MSRPRILITGGTGFIGHHLIQAAQSRDWDVTSVSLRAPVGERVINDVRYLTVDLKDAEAVKAHLAEDYEYVVNLGGYINHKLFRDGGRELIDDHFIALQNLVEFLPRNKLKRFIQIGSSDEYGDALSPQSEDLREKAISPYSMGKVASSHFLQMLNRTERFPAVILRFFLVYGPGQGEQRFLPQLIFACLAGQSFPTTYGDQERDFCYVEDIVEGVFAALERDSAIGEIFNIASGKPVTIRSVVEKVRDFVGDGTPLFGAIKYRNNESMSLYASIEKSEALLGWHPKIDFDEGLNKTIDYYRECNGNQEEA